MPEDPPPPGDEKKFTQAELDQKISERLKRAKPDDYDDLKAKAARLDALEASKKSDEEKANDRIAKLETQIAAAQAEALRSAVAAEHGIKPRWLSGTTREELEAAAKEYLEDHPTAGGAATGDGATQKPVPGKPAETLSGGGDPGDTQVVETDPAKLASSVPRQ